MRLGPAAAILAATLVVSACIPGSASPSASPSSSAGLATPEPTPSPSPAGPSPSPSFVRPTPTPLPSFGVYLVVGGDTLSSIARTFDTTPRSIAYWNGSTYPSLDPESEGYDPNRIEVGWVLQVMPGVEIPEDMIPTPAPTASPTPTPSASGSTSTPAPTPTPPPATGPSRRVDRGSRSTTQVALTFDLGGRLDPALDIMDWLIANKVQATIFPTGKSGAGTTIGLGVLQRVADHPELFVLANHSWSHPDFRDLTAAEIRDELLRTENAFVDAVGLSPRPWFRPPFGGVDDQVLRDVGAAGYSRTIMWDIDTIDWRPESDGGPTAADIVNKVVSRAQGGSIVLMHLGGFNTFEALPGIVRGLRAKGLTPVTLEDMAGV